jgi:hypothetical protein
MGLFTKLAIKWLIYQLKKDDQLWYAYQSNIAMAIYDNYNRYTSFPLKIRSQELLDFCNICANNFLKIWTK